MKIYENHAQDARYDEKDTCPTITSRYGTGGGNVPVVLMDQGGGVMSIEYDKVGTLRAQTHGHEPLILDEGGALPHVFKLRSGCDGGGKGYLGSDDLTFTLATNNDQYLMTTEPYMLAGNMIGRSDSAGPQGKGFRQETAFTLNATDVQGVAQARVRKLTPRECERLQGFPDDYTKIPYRGKSAQDCPDSPRYKAIGNSWCVPCVQWIGKRIQKELEKNEKGTEDNR